MQLQYRVWGRGKALGSKKLNIWTSNCTCTISMILTSTWDLFDNPNILHILIPTKEIFLFISNFLSFVILMFNEINRIKSLTWFIYPNPYMWNPAHIYPTLRMEVVSVHIWTSTYKTSIFAIFFCLSIWGKKLSTCWFRWMYGPSTLPHTTPLATGLFATKCSITLFCHTFWS